MALRFEIVTDPVAAQKVWDEFSPHESIDDEWSFRYSFLAATQSTLHFIVIYDGDHVIGLVPLQKHGADALPQPDVTLPEYYEYFGSDDTDSNQLILGPVDTALWQEILDALPRPVVLSPLAEPYAYRGQDATIFINKYTVGLSPYSSAEDYLEKRVGGETGSRTARQVRKIYRDYDVKIEYNQAEALEHLFEFNIQRFGSDSSFSWPSRQKTFSLLNDSQKSDTILLRINGKVVAASYAIIHSDTYICMNVGVDHEIRNLGKLMSCLEIDRAIQLKLPNFDLGKGNSGGWKSQFAFDVVPQYRLILE